MCSHTHHLTTTSPTIRVPVLTMSSCHSQSKNGGGDVTVNRREEIVRTFNTGTRASKSVGENECSEMVTCDLQADSFNRVTGDDAMIVYTQLTHNTQACVAPHSLM